jgi:hypothetical protein
VTYIPDDFPVGGWMFCDTCGCMSAGPKSGDKCNTPFKWIDKTYLGEEICQGTLRQAVINDIDHRNLDGQKTPGA